MDLVVNEWLPEYFRPAASREEKLLLQKFLERFLERGDRLVVCLPSPFLEKIERYAKTYQNQHEVVTPIRNFIKFILYDSKRCFLVEANASPEIPSPVLEKLAMGNFSSDQYLFEAASQISEQKKIVTTDARLISHFEGETWCELVLLPDFLRDY